MFRLVDWTLAQSYREALLEVDVEADALCNSRSLFGKDAALLRQRRFALRNSPLRVEEKSLVLRSLVCKIHHHGGHYTLRKNIRSLRMYV